MIEAARSSKPMNGDPDLVQGDRSVEPFLKWAGGKRWAVKRIAELAPPRYNRYIEPFLGGGSVFFALAPAHAVLSDINPDLINAYQAVRDQPADIDRCLRWLQTRHDKRLYYALREREFSSSLLRVARFIYLNRTCWNGLYRVNRNGRFNVPIGTKTAVEYPGGLQRHSAALRNAELHHADFSTTIAQARRGDFVYVDPPYTVKHNNNGFLKYNENIFSWTDQEKLAGLVKEAKRRGAFVLISNADHVSIREIFGPLGEMTLVDRASVIAGSASARGRETELLVKCY